MILPVPVVLPVGATYHSRPLDCVLTLAPDVRTSTNAIVAPVLSNLIRFTVFHAQDCDWHTRLGQSIRGPSRTPTTVCEITDLPGRRFRFACRASDLRGFVISSASKTPSLCVVQDCAELRKENRLNSGRFLPDARLKVRKPASHRWARFGPDSMAHRVRNSPLRCYDA